MYLYIYIYKVKNFGFTNMYNKKIVLGTVAPVWVWLKVVWLDREKLEEEPQMVLKFFCCIFDSEGI
jgi:hypothetical protein